VNPLWDYFWPCFAAGLLVGGPTGLVAFRRRSGRNAALIVGMAATLALTALWHGPVGGADRFEAKVQYAIQKNLIYYEMTRVSAHLHHGPLTREVVLSGPADDFQRGELVALMDELPGVSSASWSSDAIGTPLILEGLAVSVVGFLFGLLLAYLAELRRRHNAQWKW
jgi:hypothetical protein